MVVLDLSTTMAYVCLFNWLTSTVLVPELIDWALCEENQVVWDYCV